MPNFKIDSKSWDAIDFRGKRVKVLSNAALDSFSPEVLGLGDINSPSRPVEAIAAVFDLAGFTNFCKQIDPQLSVPRYLSAYLSWLMEQIKKETIEKKHKGCAELWHTLPFYLKFMGDGLLVFWDCEGLSPQASQNIIVSLSIICDRYKDEFVTKLSGVVVDAPPSLRCGIARGTVFSVGNGSDYVGSCINMATRVQKLPGISFAFNRRGFDLEDMNIVRFFKEDITIRKVEIRGIGHAELIGIFNTDLAKMSKEDAALYKKP